MDLDSSSSSGDLSSYLESRVSGLVFSGHYGERVWNEAASGFRDRVCVDDSEADAVKALRGVARRAKRMRIKLAVLEKTEETWSLLLDFSSDTPRPFGRYWFYVSSAKLGADGVEWDIRVLRPFLAGDEPVPVKCPHCGKSPTNPKASDEPLSLTDVANGLQRSFRELVDPVELARDARALFTLQNLCNIFRFILVLTMALVSGAAALLPKAWQLLNRTIHELAFLVKQTMPLMIACVEALNKTVGGLFLLIAMMWRDAKNPRPQPPQSVKALTHAKMPPRYPYLKEHASRPIYQSRVD